MKYELPNLQYKYNDLEPYIDAKTMEIHHTKHHQAYITNLNNALEHFPSLQEMPLEELLKNLDKVPEEIRMTVRNNGGGHYNHSMFWTLLSPTPKAPSLDFSKVIDENFDSLETLKELFTKAAMTRFGSGWAWLVVKSGKLEVMSTPNQDSPIMEGIRPVLGLDVWEHAYYLEYQNRRNDYVTNWWNLVNWQVVEEQYKSAIQ